MQTSEEMTMSERDRITELEHRIGQATMMAESIALEGGVRRECALRFLGALEVPVAEWPVAPEAAVADAEAPGDPDPSADPSRALARSHEGARQRAGTPEPVPGTDGMAYAALDRATERMRAAEGKLAAIERQCGKAAGVLRRGTGVPFSRQDVMVDARYILEIIGTGGDEGDG